MKKIKILQIGPIALRERASPMLMISSSLENTKQSIVYMGTTHSLDAVQSSWR
jgi:hypothetical protein